jgi:hypothetical protein
MVSKELRNAYRSSLVAVLDDGMADALTAGATPAVAGLYAGGGSVGVVNAFIPGRPGRRVGVFEATEPAKRFVLAIDR